MSMNMKHNNKRSSDGSGHTGNKPTGHGKKNTGLIVGVIEMCIRDRYNRRGRRPQSQHHIPSLSSSIPPLSTFVSLLSSPD